MKSILVFIAFMLLVVLLAMYLWARCHNDTRWVEDAEQTKQVERNW